MPIYAQTYKHTLIFRFDAATSRSVLKKKDSYFLKLSQNDITGIGEAGPLEGLSPDFGELAEKKLQEICDEINKGSFNFENYDLDVYPSVKFALETALLDLKNGGKKEIFKNDFSQSKRRIPINGLIWMGSPDFMKKQIIEKIEAGFDTIKMKIGALDFDEELKILKFIREEYKNENLTLRVDANGAFKPNPALEKLKRLSDFDLHSIEQPIKTGQEEEMAKLCEKTPIDIALDEELIPNFSRKKELLKIIKPQYIILKPSLMGGIAGAEHWIDTAENLGIKWWMTSALESNIGLNAISQLTAQYQNPLPQGLGTGQLYTNNIESPLTIENGHIFYDLDKGWD